MINPSDMTSDAVDVGSKLEEMVNVTGIVSELSGGFRIKVFHTRGFPWDDVFKLLLYRGFKVVVTNHKADLLIEASA